LTLTKPAANAQHELVFVPPVAGSFQRPRGSIECAIAPPHAAWRDFVEGGRR